MKQLDIAYNEYITELEAKIKEAQKIFSLATKAECAIARIDKAIAEVDKGCLINSYVVCLTPEKARTISLSLIRELVDTRDKFIEVLNGLQYKTYSPESALASLEHLENEYKSLMSPELIVAVDDGLGDSKTSVYALLMQEEPC